MPSTHRRTLATGLAGGGKRLSPRKSLHSKSILRVGITFHHILLLSPIRSIEKFEPTTSSV